MTVRWRFPCAVAAALLCAGCPGEDSWKHYSGGGMYATGSPSMSPDGATIVFSSPRTGHGDIYKIDRDGSNAVRLTDSEAFEADPIFSPDGETIAFVREADGCRHVWQMNKDGSNQRQLTSGQVLDDVYTFSSDGSQLFFGRSPLSFGLGKVCTRYALDLRKKTVKKVEGVASPDGKRIAYHVSNESARRGEVWIMEADGSNKHFLAAGCMPRFSPDGRILYALDSQPNTTDLGQMWMISDADGSHIHRIGRCLGPVFTADGKHIVCFSPEYRQQVWKMDPDGSNRTVLPIPAGNTGILRPCRDGFILNVVSGNDRVGDIWVINTKDWTAHFVAPMR
jgi:Tol biopolymer transport system component